ncbi:related to Origin recognition complex subunit 4 [Saccharomycodes ludwigii]|uniref:Origin recognition complex subunit 4 n=1 Tax=Saccharomycodes ludwigii TaxID=36035 RepID=A0A376B9X7_9ASCO|nr:hypothetical protein SCDLUD_000044 [Saccharomycodes ludwigii]KAH3902467.1 hypothetical protein SCDLUD_000044 [Saccharomycodes ludwigii]SSD61379.1 related to Origin recognition complex subunit 4 [Saccharomycodes ludwigii]
MTTKRKYTNTSTTTVDTTPLQNNKKPKNFNEKYIEELRIKLLEKNKEIPLYLLDSFNQVDTILKQTVITKENHSAILVGPRANYKTLSIETSLNNLKQKYNDQFIVIKLNGIIHTEESAISSMATQLELQLQKLRGDSFSLYFEEELAEREKALDKNSEAVNLDYKLNNGSLIDIFQRFLQIMNYKSTDTRHKREKVSMVFIFDEIDSFAGPVRQTLLYNLFDMVEGSQISFCIIGCTTKINIMEFLEKRVKSRFSNRIIYFPKPANYKEFTDSVFHLLKIKDATNEAEQCWNQKLFEQINISCSPLNNLIKKNFDSTKDIRKFFNLFQVVFTKYTFPSFQISDLSLIEKFDKNRLKSGLTSRVKSLSDLELSILIAAARVSIKTNDNVNFNLVYDEYSSLLTSINASIPSVFGGMDIDKTYKKWNKQDIKNVWENLLDLNFLVEKGALGIRESALQAFVASNYHTIQSSVSFDLRNLNVLVTLQELRRIIPSSSLLYQWTTL